MQWAGVHVLGECVSVCVCALVIVSAVSVGCGVLRVPFGTLRLAGLRLRWLALVLTVAVGDEHLIDCMFMSK